MSTREHIAFALVAVLMIVYGACGEKHPCAPDDLRALRQRYEERAVQEIKAGHCAGFMSVDDCPSYKLIELEFTLEAERMAPCR